MLSGLRVPAMWHLIRARYGVQLEKGPFDKRTADFLWMMILSMTTILVSFFSMTSFVKNERYGHPSLYNTRFALLR